ncbi:transmembrane 9 superfamily member 7 [Parachaetomium inaequale]|uniref:Transmembrane 9 superfamily member n=1 Tax=Parachaetomium inaequale TaxID=2588326 RepID=A0AAN6SQ76_9PEZI|nr:transmembrane 9 superfamily member 7 [Parachaetomium inaequale]
MKPPTLLTPLPLFLFLLTPAASAFYIPFFTTRTYAPSAPIPLLVNKVYSDTTQLQYAYADLPFVCPPSTGSTSPPTTTTPGSHHARARSVGNGLVSGQHIPLNLGEVLRGDRIVVSDVQLRMQEDSACKLLCERQVTRAGVEKARELVRGGYVVEWIVDNLPGATSFVTVDKSRKYYAAGFRLGGVDLDFEGGRYFLNNHHTVIIRYRRAPGKRGERGEMVVVGFEVYPKSVGAGVERREDGCPVELGRVREKFELPVLQGNGTAGAEDAVVTTIPYTYSVYFREDSSIEWARRWDLYFVNQEEGARVHWMAIVNSLIICGLLTAIVLMILARTIRLDIRGHREGVAEDGKLRSRRTKSGPRTPVEKAGGLSEQTGEGEDEADLSDDALEDVAGWKLLNGDVFRPPQHGHLLAPLVGCGTQLLFMAVGLVLLSAVGVLNPSFRGGFISFGVGLFVFAGLFSGYFSARVFKTFGGRDWRRNMAVTALLVPGLLFAIVFVLNLFVWAQASSTAIPFGTLVAIIALWLGIQLPLVYAGARYGFLGAGSWEHPTKTSAAPPRPVPPQAWYSGGLRTALLAGLIPFAVIFIELLFVFQSVWQDKSGYYYVFGFLAVVSTILLVTVAEVTVVTVYLQLCAENYCWWWQSFWVGGGSAVWVFAYCVWYYCAKLHITGFVSSMLFFAYSFMACCVYGLLTGTVGFLTAYAFVRRIYGAIKVD